MIYGNAIVSSPVISQEITPAYNTNLRIVRNVVAQGKSDKLTEIDRQKSLRNKNELLELKSRNQGRITLATQKQH